jgi:hypothetical protein
LESCCTEHHRSNDLVAPGGAGDIYWYYLTIMHNKTWRRLQQHHWVRLLTE